CSTSVSPARPRPCPSSPNPNAFARVANNRWTVPTPTRVVCKRGPARPNGANRKGTVPAVGGLFFPQAKSLGIDQSETSPALQHKIVYAGIASRSFAQASVTLERLAELSVGAKQVERLTEGIGDERVAERDAAVAAFAALPFVEKFVAPPGVTPPELAVVMTDGGRLQIRDPAPTTEATRGPNDGAAAGSVPATASVATAPDWEEEEPPKKGHWREDKVGLLLAMTSTASAADPCPDIPAAFLDVVRIPKLVRQL